MENRLQATFVPRQSVVPGGDLYARAKSPTNFLMVIGVTVCIIVIGAYGGLYFYKGHLKDTNDLKKTKVENEINNFEPELTKKLTTLRARLDTGKQLLDNHNALSLLFSLLEFNTAQTVRFNSFTYSIADKKIQIALQGEARSYNAVAYESDVFSTLAPLKNPVFSNLSLNEKGLIGFNVIAELDPSYVQYNKLFQSADSHAGAASTATSSSASSGSPATGINPGSGSASTTPAGGTATTTGAHTGARTGTGAGTGTGGVTPHATTSPTSPQ